MTQFNPERSFAVSALLNGNGSKIALALMLVAVPASHARAQAVDAVQANEASEPGEANGSEAPGIVVTGSRIAGTGFAAPSPTTVFDAGEIAKTGASNIAQLAAQIPAFQALTSAASTTTSSSNAGQSYLNLRGLGNNRTLVLVNTRRFVPTSSSGLVNVGVVPSSLIERVEVVTGGASAAYGSDAVAGVVNIILKKKLEGLSGDVQSGLTTYGDNATYKGSLAWGTSFAGDRGHFLIAAEGEKIKGIKYQSERRWANQAYGLLSNPGYTPTNGQYKYLIQPDQQMSNATLGGLITSGPLKGLEFLSDGGTREFQYGKYVGSSFMSGGGGVSASGYSPLVVPTERYSFYSTGDYAVSDSVTAFFEVSHSFSRGDSDNLIAPYNFANITISNTNAFLPDSVVSKMATADVTSFTMGRYSVDMGFIGSDVSNRTTRAVGGLEGELGNGFKWNVYGEYGHTIYKQVLTDNVVKSKFNNAVNSVRVGGVATCAINANASTADDDPSCVPVNLFGYGSPTQKAINYFTADSLYRQKIDERVIAANLTGDLFQFGGKSVSFATGAEYREEKTSAVTDAISAASGFLIGNPQAIAGSFNVKEVYAELSLPLLHDLPVIKSLDIDGAVRRTDYSTSGVVWTWKAGANWQLDDNIRLRFTRSRDIRAPNLDELFTSAQMRVSTIIDPFDSDQQHVVQRVTSGNPNLRPEVAKTITAGIVLTPTFIPGFRASVDYYDIKISDAITVLQPQDVIDRCYAGNAALCNFLVHDGGALGPLTQVNVQQVNVVSQQTRGLDFEAMYRFPLTKLGLNSSGTVTLRGLATYVDKLETGDGVTSVDLAGDVGANKSGGLLYGLPHWRFSTSLTYENGPLTLWVQDRYVGGGVYDKTFAPQDLQNNHINGRNYVNISAQLKIVDDGRKKFEVFGNVENLFDVSPPHNPSTFFASAQTNSVLYDVIGRMIKVGVRFGF